MSATEGITDGLWRGEGNCINPKAGDADVWIEIWEELHSLSAECILVEVEHVKAHRTKKDKKEMSQFEKFVTKGHEKADEMAKAGAMLDKGFLAEARAKTMQQEREEMYTALQYAASFLCLVGEWKDCEEVRPKPKAKWIFVDQKREETKHRTEWCVEANKYRCMRCGRSSEYMTMPGKCKGPKFLSTNRRKWRSRYLEVPRFGKKSGAGNARDTRDRECDPN